MAFDLHATRLRIPPVPPRAVRRARLLDQLETGVPAARLTLVATPAGSGKSTLLAQWARTSDLRVAWLTAEEGDNDLDHFLRDLIRAWEAIQPDIRETHAGIILGTPGPDREQALAAFVTTVGESPGHTALVIDDAHLLTAPDVHGTLEVLLDTLPPTVHLVLAGRGGPPLALARRRARGELLELRSGDLAFDLAESHDLLNRGMGLDLVDDQVAGINDRLEGWATGLQLVALTLRQQPTPDVASLIAGRHRHVVDYLSEEVLARLPEETRTFLFQTCILDRLTASLCTAVTGNAQSQAMLESMERANLFLMPLDDVRTWFRYQRVFADFLRQALPREVDDIEALHARAAAWFHEHRYAEQAFQHALAARSIDLVSQVLVDFVPGKMFAGEASVVVGWFEALPAGWLEARPDLMVSHASFRLLMGQPDVAQPILDHVDALPGKHQPEIRQSVGRTSALRCFAACFRNDLPMALEHADRAFQLLPQDDHVYLTNLYHALGDTYRSHGRWDDARSNYLKVIDLAPRARQSSQVRMIHLHANGALADLELRQGHLREAGRYWTRAQRTVEDPDTWGTFTLPVTGWILVRLGELAYEWNDLDEARDRVRRGVQRTELGGEPQAAIAGRLIQARLDLTDGNLDAAEAHLDGAAELLARASFPAWQGILDRSRVDLWLARRQPRLAVSWAESVLPSIGVLDESTQLGIARGLVESTDSSHLHQAVSLLDGLVTTAGGQGLLGVEIEALALRAMLHHRRDDQARMLTDLERALRLAEPEGYVRRFADLGTPMVRILQHAQGRQVMPEYVSTVLAAFDGAGTSGARLPIDPLSEREREVLALIVAGLSNREIAERLFVSPETVKKHTGNIYGKLGVRGRVEAAARARDLSIIA